MHIINITVRDKIATHVGDAYYVCGNTDYEVHFDFDDEWAAMESKTARFIRDDGVHHDKVFSGSVCPFPDEPPISNTNSVRVGVYAGNLCTTTPARVPAVKSILCPGGPPAAPADNVYHQIMQRLDDERNTFIVVLGPDGQLNRTRKEIQEAANAGLSCFLVRHDGTGYDGHIYVYAGETQSFSPDLSGQHMTFVAPIRYIFNGMEYRVVYITDDNKGVHCGYASLKAPNPYKLTIAGQEYDGRKAVTVLPVPADTTATAYLRWNGAAYVPATIAELKADLGLT